MNMGGFSGSAYRGNMGGVSGSAFRGGSYGSIGARSPMTSNFHPNGVANFGSAARLNGGSVSGLSAGRINTGNFSAGRINAGTAGHINAGTLNRGTLGGVNGFGANRAAISGVRAPWSGGTAIAANRAVVANRATFGAGFHNGWNNYFRTTSFNHLGASRYGWMNHNNLWVNNNFWYRNYGYRWNRGFWPWWYRFGYWPGWYWGGGYGYGGYGYGGYGYGYGGYGYGYGYNNPYYMGAAYGPVYYDYSQPLPATPDDPNQMNTGDVQGAMAQFDAARDAFKQGDYTSAQQGVDAAIQVVQSDSSMHEFRALTLFAQQRYDEAAEALYPVLAAGPGWSWNTMWSLYPNAGAYTTQLRKLEDYVETHDTSAPANFLLAYHYMVTGHLDHAAQRLQKVVELQPKDQLAKSLLDMLSNKDGNAQGGPPAPTQSLTPNLPSLQQTPTSIKQRSPTTTTPPAPLATPPSAQESLPPAPEPPGM